MSYTFLSSFFPAAPGDYQSSSITLTQAQLVGGTYEVTVPVKDDSVLETQETFQAQLELTQQSLDLGVVSLGQSTGDVLITDDDGEGNHWQLNKV